MKKYKIPRYFKWVMFWLMWISAWPSHISAVCVECSASCASCHLFFLNQRLGILVHHIFCSVPRLQVSMLLFLWATLHGPCWYRVTYIHCWLWVFSHHCILSSTMRPCQFYYIQSYKPMIRLNFNSFIFTDKFPWIIQLSSDDVPIVLAKGAHDPLFLLGPLYLIFIS